MTTVKITRWGNSCGIRVPAQQLKSSNLQVGDELEIKSDGKGGLTLKPIKKIREGWLEAFNQVADAGGDELLMGDMDSDFDKDEWKW